MDTVLTTRKVGILGGMGPAAGADFLRLFVDACDARLRAMGSKVSDQAFPEHWLVQVPVPDRTQALVAGGASPFTGMRKGIRGLARHGVASIAIACNTAHAWHAQLQATCPDIELLHIVRETASFLGAGGVGSVCLLATQGTYKLGLYQTALAERGVKCHLPTNEERARVMRGIRDGVKAGDLRLAERLFVDVASRMIDRHGCKSLVLACTEIPLALHRLPAHGDAHLIDPAQVLARALASRAYLLGAPG